MSELVWFLFFLTILTAVAWVSWRAGRATARRDAEYMISTLKRLLIVTRRERDAETERAAWLGRSLMTATPVEPSIPEWMTGL